VAITTSYRPHELAEFKVFTDEVGSAEAQGSPDAAAVNS
jgi:hypothetical protein